MATVLIWIRRLTAAAATKALKPVAADVSRRIHLPSPNHPPRYRGGYRPDLDPPPYGGGGYQGAETRSRRREPADKSALTQSSTALPQWLPS